MAEPFLGEIKMVGFNFAPVGWAFCSGSLLSIGQNTALFSLLGTYYGGDGQTTFALPDLRSRFPIGQFQGPGLQNYSLGDMAGEEVVTITPNQMPAHSHLLQAGSAAGNTRNPDGAILAREAAGQTALYSSSGATDVTMNPASIGVAGGSQPHGNLPPYLCINFIIALQGIFPSRG